MVTRHLPLWGHVNKTRGGEGPTPPTPAQPPPDACPRRTCRPRPPQPAGPQTAGPEGPGSAGRGRRLMAGLTPISPARPLESVWTAPGPRYLRKRLRVSGRGRPWFPCCLSTTATGAARADPPHAHRGALQERGGLEPRPPTLPQPAGPWGPRKPRAPAPVPTTAAGQAWLGQSCVHRGPGRGDRPDRTGDRGGGPA